MDLLFFLIVGFALGYWTRSLKTNSLISNSKSSSPNISYQQKLLLKSYHQTDSDRIRELNKLTRNESIFLRLLKQTFIDYEIAIKQRRFIILDKDAMPCAIFEYRDGTVEMKLVDQEDGLALYLYKGMISADAIKQDYISITSQHKPPM